MTPNLALDYIKRRMSELGYHDKYHMQLRHLILQSGENVKFKAYNSYCVLAEEPAQVQVKSQNGLFDLTLTTATELKYEHHGLIQFRNLGQGIARVRFIQVIPYK